jgi:hypothetical protein
MPHDTAEAYLTSEQRVWEHPRRVESNSYALGKPDRRRRDCPTVCVTGRDLRVRDRVSRAGQDHDRDHNFF